MIYAARMVCTISQLCLRFLFGQPSTPTLGSIKVNMFSVKMSQLEIFLLMWLGGLTKAQVRYVLWTYIVYIVLVIGIFKFNKSTLFIIWQSDAYLHEHTIRHIKNYTYLNTSCRKWKKLPFSVKRRTLY